MTSNISWRRYVAAGLILVIGSLLMAFFGTDKAHGVPSITTDRAHVVASARIPGKTAPWNLPAWRKGDSCGYLNPYTGNMGSCLLKRGGLASPTLTAADRRIISCAGQAFIAASASLVVTPIAAPAVVAATSTLATCAWVTLAE